MFDLIAHWASLHLMTPWGLAAAVVGLISVGMVTIPAQTLAIITNWRTWALVGVLAAYLAYHEVKAQNDDLKAQNAVLSTQVQGVAGETAAISAKLQSTQTSAARTIKLKNVAAQAPEGKKEDAVLDQVNADDLADGGKPAPQPAPAPAPGGSRLDGLLDTLTGRPVGPGNPHS